MHQACTCSYSCITKRPALSHASIYIAIHIYRPDLEMFAECVIHYFHHYPNGWNETSLHRNPATRRIPSTPPHIRLSIRKSTYVSQSCLSSEVPTSRPRSQRPQRSSAATMAHVQARQQEDLSPASPTRQRTSDLHLRRPEITSSPSLQTHLHPALSAIHGACGNYI